MAAWIEILNFPSCVEKYFMWVLCSLMNYFKTVKEKFYVSAPPWYIHYLLPFLSCCGVVGSLTKSKALSSSDVGHEFVAL